MKRPTPPTRSLTEVPGWDKLNCQKCKREFWSVPSQTKYTLFCSDECRYDPPEVVLAASTTKGHGPNDCWLCSLTPSNPYPYIKVKGISIRACRFVLAQKLGRPIGKGLLALHSKECVSTKCIRPDHLREGTQKENIQQARDTGRLDDRKGEKCPTSKLNEAQARDIKFNPDGLSGKELTIKHSISKSQVSGIQHGRMWRDLSP